MTDSTRVLVPLTASPCAEAALEHALRTFPAAEIVVLGVITSLDANVGGGLVSASDERHRRKNDRASAAASATLRRVADDRRAEFDGELSSATVEGRPVSSITEYAEAHDVDHIVLGDDGRYLLERLVGNIATGVVRRASIPVTVVDEAPV